MKKILAIIITSLLLFLVISGSIIIFVGFRVSDIFSSAFIHNL